MRLYICFLAFALCLLSTESPFGRVRADGELPLPPAGVQVAATGTEEWAIRVLDKAQELAATASESEKGLPERERSLRQALTELTVVLSPDSVSRLKGKPELLEAYLLRARIISALGDHDKAIEDARFALTSFPEAGAARESLSETLFARGSYRQEQGEYQSAITDFKSAIGSVAKPKYHAALGAALAVSSLDLDRGKRAAQLQQAMAEGREAIRRDPKTFAWKFNQGSILALAATSERSNGNPDEAARLSREAVFLAPGVRAFHLARMEALISQGKIDSALHDGDVALALSPRDHALRRRVNLIRAERAEYLLRDGGSPDEALKLIDDAIRSLADADEPSEQNEYYFALRANARRQVADRLLDRDPVTAMTHFYDALKDADSAIKLDGNLTYRHPAANTYAVEQRVAAA